MKWAVRAAVVILEPNIRIHFEHLVLRQSEILNGPLDFLKEKDVSTDALTTRIVATRGSPHIK